MITSAFGIEMHCVQRPIDFPKDRYTYLCEPTQFFLSIPGVATYQVCAINNIVYIDPDPLLTQPSLINTWLHGTVLSYLLQYHGYLVLHGSSIVLDDAAVIFSGHSGIGKSTLAMAMVARGYPLLTDDLVVIRYVNGAIEMMPAFGRAKLWKDSLLQLGKTTQGLQPVLNKPDKYEIIVEHSWDHPIVIRKFYDLNCANNSAIEINRVNDFDALKVFIKNTYRYAMLKPLGKLGVHLQQIQQLNDSIDTYHLLRSNLHFELEALADAIEIHMTR